MRETWESFRAGERWTDGSAHGAWRSIYNGYGVVGIASDGDLVLRQRPRRATDLAQTHAGLVISRRRFHDVDVTVRMRTTSQLRGANANPWETGWLLWHYTDDTHFYYAILKPNGWELGKEDPAYPGAQRFLATGSQPRFPIGRWHTVRIRHQGATISLWGNGRRLATITDRERPYRRGSIGLYNEDADARFDRVTVSAL